MPKNFNLQSGWEGLEEGAHFYGSSTHRFLDAVHRGEVLGAHRTVIRKFGKERLEWCGHPGGIVGPVSSGGETKILPKNTIGIKEIRLVSGAVSSHVVATSFTSGKGKEFSRVTLASLPLSGGIAQVIPLLREYDENGKPCVVDILEYYGHK